MQQHERHDFFVNELVTELRRIERFVREEPSIQKKIYYFSAAFGVTSRTLRYSFSKDVLLTDFVLHQVYNILIERWSTHIRQGDELIGLDAKHFEILCDELHDLAYCFEKNQNILKPLENIMTIGFKVTGPGNYLFEKGDLKL